MTSHNDYPDFDTFGKINFLISCSRRLPCKVPSRILWLTSVDACVALCAAIRLVLVGEVSVSEFSLFSHFLSSGLYRCPSDVADLTIVVLDASHFVSFSLVGKKDRGLASLVACTKNVADTHIETTSLRGISSDVRHHGGRGNVYSLVPRILAQRGRKSALYRRWANFVRTEFRESGIWCGRNSVRTEFCEDQIL
ncbi:hypothetical protein KC321_g4 [Hortaea werneckii]|nr:hypothetical protein KC321_g4 [Hortaea werneckii]